MQPPDVFHTLISGAVPPHKVHRVGKKVFPPEAGRHQLLCLKPAACVGALKEIKQIEKTSSTNHKAAGQKRCSFITCKNGGELNLIFPLRGMLLM